MAAHGRRALRDLFDESPTPHIAHPPQTHHRDFYVATDGSFREQGGGLGVVIETQDGTRVARVAFEDAPPNNNVAEYRALHLGLDVLAVRAPADSSVGVLLDHDDLAAKLNAAVLLDVDGDWTIPTDVTVPAASSNHWRGIRARVEGFDDVRAARIRSDQNPAHPLANAPGKYAHVNSESPKCVRPDCRDEVGVGTTDEGHPPPSRARRRPGN